MAAPTRNVLPLLLDASGTPKTSFTGISTEDLRLGLVQLIDGLERMDELATASNALADDWRQSRIAPSQLWNDVITSSGNPLASTPLEDFSKDGDATAGYQWMTEDRKFMDVSQMGREDLHIAIRESFQVLERFRQLTEAAARDAVNILKGVRVQAECDKDDFREYLAHTVAASSQPSRPKPR